MMPAIYNSLTREKERFAPLRPGRAGIYVCGVTVYDLCHVGHARVMVVFDIIYRWLMHCGLEVDYVRNFTDVDDKIIHRAAERGVTIDALSDEMIAAFHQDVDALNCLRPTHEPRATAHMADMIAMIEALVAGGHAYQADSGDVLYAVRSFAEYGRLSGKNIDELEAGSRVDVDAAKRDPLDFVLWKKAKPGEPAWDSPWGLGRPGWHIECSAMSCAHLGDTFDIHGGGMDLKFPHHENEIAQAVAATGGGFARYWIHNGFVNINAEKMSKSLGNFFTLREVYAKYAPEVLRMFILGTHYRSPLDFSDTALASAKAGLDRLYETVRRVQGSGVRGQGSGVRGQGSGVRGQGSGVSPQSSSLSPQSSENCRLSPSLSPAFISAMNDDFNTPGALAAVFEKAREVNRCLDSGEDTSEAAAVLTAMCGLLGIVQQDADNWFQGEGMDAPGIERLIAERTEARRNRNFARADAIRDELAAAGVVLEDTAEGTVWRKK